MAVEKFCRSCPEILLNELEILPKGFRNSVNSAQQSFLASRGMSGPAGPRRPAKDSDGDGDLRAEKTFTGGASDSWGGDREVKRASLLSYGTGIAWSRPHPRLWQLLPESSPA